MILCFVILFHFARHFVYVCFLKDRDLLSDFAIGLFLKLGKLFRGTSHAILLLPLLSICGIVFMCPLAQQ